MTVMVVCLQVCAGCARCVRTARAGAARRSDKTAAPRRRWRRVNNRRSWLFSSKAFSSEACPGRDPGWVQVRVKKTRQNLKPFAGVGVTYSNREEAEAKGQHQDIQHQVLLVVLVSLRHSCEFQGRRIAQDQHGIAGAIRALPVSVAVRCHSLHRFSRRQREQSYRNLIKTRFRPAQRSFSLVAYGMVVLRASASFSKNARL